MTAPMSHVNVGSKAMVKRKPLAGHPFLTPLAIAKWPCLTSMLNCSSAFVENPSKRKRSNFCLRWVSTCEIREVDTAIIWHASTLSEGSRLNLEDVVSYLLVATHL